uniref:Synembryn-A n=1 Tax=Acrobeloides nanus TaxID=290746 RepID=A0A914CD92_9BILA
MSFLLLNSWKEEKDEAVKRRDFEALNEHLATKFTFPEITHDVKKELADFIASEFDQASSSYKCAQIRTVRFLSRDKSGVEVLFTEDLIELIIESAHLEKSSTEESYEVISETAKCLVNALYNSDKVRKVFEVKSVDLLLERISFLLNKIQNNTTLEKDEKFKYFSKISSEELQDLFFLDLRIAFIVTAHSLNVQKNWLNDVDNASVFLNTLLLSAKNLNNLTQKEKEWGNEALKILFNLFCHAKLFDLDFAQKCADECARIIKTSTVDPDFKQNCVNLLAVMPATLESLCPKIEGQPKSTKVYEDYDVEFADATLALFDERIDNLDKKDIELLGTFFTSLIYLCKNHKAARRYCRLKVIPPLHAKHVELPPDEGKEFRNKIIRIMRSDANCRELAAEFLFILCKRSVPRLIKYTGFGHAAGILANSGLLGAINEKKRDSDSEASDTEDYKEVEDLINPVTGYIEPHRENPLANMTEEQKEYEAMKLANAMSKLMEEGVFTPGTIGEDGRVRAVSHVNELVKNVNVKEELESDSDID